MNESKQIQYFVYRAILIKFHWKPQRRLLLDVLNIFVPLKLIRFGVFFCFFIPIKKKASDRIAHIRVCMWMCACEGLCCTRSNKRFSTSDFVLLSSFTRLTSKFMNSVNTLIWNVQHCFPISRGFISLEAPRRDFKKYSLEI